MIQPNPEIVGITWLKAVLGMPNSVNTTLPRDNTTWAASGFVQLIVIGGSPQIEVGMRQPVYQVDCWANNANSNKPPWGKASDLAERILANCYDKRDRQALTLPGQYYPVQVHSAYALTEPRRIPDDPSSFARFQMDLAIHWTVKG